MADIQSVDGTLNEHSFAMRYNTHADVATTSTSILPSYAGRKYALITNDSDTVIYLALHSEAFLNNGIRLNPNGGSYEINWTNLYTGQICGIHAGTGNKVVTVVEGD